MDCDEYLWHLRKMQYSGMMVRNLYIIIIEFTEFTEFKEGSRFQWFYMALSQTLADR